MKHIPHTLVREPNESLYASDAKVYPREIDGRFARLRIISVFWLLGMFYLFPWLRWDGHQAVLFDLPARKFHIFSLTFWPQDFYLLTLLLIIAAVSLFFFTALAGRLWCGYACPQTVWTETFLWMERWTEGTRNQRIKLDASPWTRNKIFRKCAKQALWIGFSAWTGFTFVGFFTPITDLAHGVATGTLSAWELFWVVFYGFATYGNAGFLREQVCKYMCPYARFQGAMFDRDSLIISYDIARGEPRGGRSRNADLAQLKLGDCIDCAACVQVCPTGIDIRDGLQYECIACAACVDACDSVMDRMNYPRGLIRYTTENVLDGGKHRLLRPRILIYASLLLLLCAGFILGVGLRRPLLVELMHDRNALYRESGAGEIENSYIVRLVNKTDSGMDLHLEIVGKTALRLLNAPPAHLDANETQQIALTVTTESGPLATKQPLRIALIDTAGNLVAHADSQFFVPPSVRSP
ncbi:MAG: cytochrome c oxidase accessory protein CcoG [Tahibacter sp.]